MLRVLTKILSHASAEEKTKRLEDFKFRTFTGRFRLAGIPVSIMHNFCGLSDGFENAVTGVYKHFSCGLTRLSSPPPFVSSNQRKRQKPATRMTAFLTV